MKKNVFSLLVALILGFNGCINAQNTSPKTQIIEMLTEFYIEYNAVWSKKPPLAHDALVTKLDELNAKYCTPKLREKAKEFHDSYGQDLLTNDLGSVDLNENLKVTKDSSGESVYIVSFTATNSDASGNPVKQEVVLHVTVIKEGETYKIDEVN